MLSPAFWDEVPYRVLRKGARRKILKPKVLTTLFARVVSRVACACFSVCLSLTLIESRPVFYGSAGKIVSITNPTLDTLNVSGRQCQT